MATKLNDKQQSEVMSLIEQFQNICVAQANVSKPGWHTAINLTKDESNDYVDIPIPLVEAKNILKAQRASVMEKLRKLGIEVE